ncbi:MAG: cytochrome c oxidase subunit II, partial [Mesorhizobium sp.]
MRKFMASARLLAGAAAAGALLSGVPAYADQPQPWETAFQAPATEMMRQIEWFGNYTMWFVVPITVLVLALLAVCVLRF